MKSQIKKKILLVTILGVTSNIPKCSPKPVIIQGLRFEGLIIEFPIPTQEVLIILPLHPEWKVPQARHRLVFPTSCPGNEKGK